MEINNLEKCIKIIKEAKEIVVLTGAGISTESGIKDFRSRTGIYRQSPEYILSLDFFYKHPKEFYQFAIENLYHPEALPNVGHQILAKWEEEGKVSTIITQNIDGLHQKAGSNHVIEFHGTMRTASCMNCGKVYRTEEMMNRIQTMEDYFICTHCQTREEHDHYIKPDVVLFGDAGEWFTAEGFSTITNIIHQADCILVLGTSLQVTPFSTFPQYRREGVPIILINKGDSPYDHAHDTYVIHESIGATLTQINKE
ncbi:NAD-dependent deacetylase [Mesobacillus persicus]|uniref:protein acetyllysine N-acetyltransferase n=1 Tax=Mesobacillus persicus TaxID=930146 RepID=A0A1H7WEV8_9BACI|nr:NAD-dependent protein deacylase [Mesobacillus persicus]SEM19874.1 NAD-dependent deacetylase [Mesobacillus persicus]